MSLTDSVLVNLVSPDHQDREDHHAGSEDFQQVGRGLEENLLEDERHDDPRGVISHADDVGLLDLKGEDEEELNEVSGYCEPDNSPAVVVTVWEAVETHDSTDDGELEDAEDPGGDGEGGPVHVPEVPEDDGHGAAQALSDRQNHSSDHHLLIVLNIGSTHLTYNQLTRIEILHMKFL